MPKQPTPTQQIIEIRLGRPVADFVREQQNLGHGWRHIAQQIRFRTDISVSHEALRSWVKDTAA